MTFLSKILNQYDKLTLITAGLFLLVLPYGIQLTSYSILLYATCVIFVEYFYKKNFEFNKRLLFLLFISTIPFVLILTSLIYADSNDEVWKILERNLAFLIFPILTLPRKEMIELKHLNILLFVFILSILGGALYIYFNLGINIYKSGDSISDIFRWKYSYTNLVSSIPSVTVNYFAFYTLCSLIIVAESRPTFLPTKVKIVVALFFLFMIIHLNVRICILIAIAYGLYYILFHWQINPYLKIGVLGTSLFLFLFLTLKMNYIQKRLPIEINNNQIHIKDKRFNRWLTAIKTLDKDNVWFGFGAGNAKEELVQSYINSQQMVAVEERYNAHNQYLQIVLEYGVIGLILFGVFFYLILKSVNRNKQRIFFTIIISFLAFSLTESTLKRQKGIVFLAYICSLAIQPKEKFE